MSTKIGRMGLAAGLVMSTWLSVGASTASAQYYGPVSGYGRGQVHHHHRGCGHQGYGPVYRGGYSYGSSYYGRGSGYSSYGGYAPGRGAYFGNSSYGRGYGSSSYFGYTR